MFARRDETKMIAKPSDVILRKRIKHAMVETPITKESGNQLKGG
jgi:hypothetical protein